MKIYKLGPTVTTTTAATAENAGNDAMLRHRNDQVPKIKAKIINQDQIVASF
jgi:hypothetical protein